MKTIGIWTVLSLTVGSFLFPLVSGIKHEKISSKLNEDFSIKCPEKQGVYGIEVEFKGEFLAVPRPYHEWQFSIYCRSFIEDGEKDKGDESCEDKEPVPIAFNELVFEESKMNCDCNQYLAGITGKIDKEKYHGEADQQRRMISLRCCRKKNNFIEIRTCEMVGPKTLYFPEGPVKFNALKDWDVDGNFKNPKFFVTGVSIYENMMMVQQCRFAVEKHHKKAKELKKKIKDAKCDFWYMRDMMNDYSKIKKCEDIPVGWPRPMVLSNQDPTLLSTFQTLGYKYFNKTTPLAADFLLFSDQFTVCADGQVIYSVSKYVRYDAKQQKKDYIFLTKCAELERQPCMCQWNTTCDEKNWNKTCADDISDDTAKCQKYWAGFKSEYIKKTNRRKFEIFCCTSSEINFVDCNWTRWQNDSDVKMILPKPRIKSYSQGGVGDVVGFRDFRVKWEGKNMLVQYNICNTNDSGSPGCHYPCFPKLDQEYPKESDQPAECRCYKIYTTSDPSGLAALALLALAGIKVTTTPATSLTTILQTTTVTIHTTTPATSLTRVAATVTTKIPSTTTISTSASTTPSTTSSSTSTTSTSTTTTPTTTSTSTTTTTTTCSQGINFVIMMDSSTSLGPSGYAAEQSFLAALISNFNFASSGGIAASQLTLLEFGDSVTTRISSTDFTSTTANVDITNKLNSLTWAQSTTTNILGALGTANTLMGSIPSTDTRPKVAIILTDGYNSVPDTSDASQNAVVDAAISLQNTIGTANFYGVGMTPDANVELPNLVGPTQFYYADTFAVLNTLVAGMQSQVCGSAQFVPTTTPTTTSTSTSTTTTTTPTTTSTTSATTETPTTTSTTSTTTTTTTTTTPVVTETNTDTTTTSTTTTTTTPTTSTTTTTPTTSTTTTTTTPTTTTTTTPTTSTTSTSTTSTTTTLPGCPAIDASLYLPNIILYSDPPMANGLYSFRTIAYLSCPPSMHWSRIGNSDHTVTYRSLCSNYKFRAFSIGNDACKNN